MTSGKWHTVGRYIAGGVTLICTVLATWFGYLQVYHPATATRNDQPVAALSPQKSTDDGGTPASVPSASPTASPSADPRETTPERISESSTGTNEVVEPPIPEPAVSKPKVEPLPDPGLARTFCSAGTITVSFDVKPDDHVRHRMLGGSVSHRIECAADQHSFRIVSGERLQDGPGGVFSRNGLTYSFSYVASGLIITCQVNASRAKAVPMSGTISCDRPDYDVAGRAAEIGT